VIARVPPLLALLSAAWLLAAGCGGTAVTLAPTPTPSPTPIRNPEDLIVRSLDALLSSESFHVRADMEGRASLSILVGEESILGRLGAAVDLGDSYVEGDIDVTDQAADLAFEVPGFPTGLNGRVVVADGHVYTRISILGGNYNRSTFGELPSALQPGDRSDAARARRIEFLRASLDDAGITAVMRPMEVVDGSSYYHASITIPLDSLNAALSEGGGYAARIKVESIFLEYWVFEETLLPASLKLTADAGESGHLRAELVFSRYGEPVRVMPPDPGQVG
jgi:hypothetical protein